MIKGADIERVANEAVLEGGTSGQPSEVEPPKWSLSWSLAKDRFCPGLDVSEEIEGAVWLAFGIYVGSRLWEERSGRPSVEATDDQVRQALADDDALDEEHDNVPASLRAVGVDPSSAIHAAVEIVLDGQATDPDDAARTFLRGLRISLRLDAREAQ